MSAFCIVAKVSPTTAEKPSIKTQELMKQKKILLQYQVLHYCGAMFERKLYIHCSTKRTLSCHVEREKRRGFGD